MLKTFYLDMNIVADCVSRGNAAILSKINKLKSNGYTFPYSPAHIEEVACIARNSGGDGLTIGDSINQHLLFLSNLSDNREYFPTPEGGVILQIENPAECMSRVLEFYSANSYVEQIEKDRLESIRLIPCFPEFNPIILNNIEPENVFKDSDIRNLFEKITFGYDMNNIELITEIIFNFLDTIGYRREKKGKHRSKMHDITHCRYATASDFLVTDDKRFLAKCKAAYRYLNLQTKILNKEEFISFCP